MSAKILMLARCAVAAIGVGAAAAASATPIAYLALTEGYWEAWSCEPDGSSPRQLTRFGADVARVSWYPDGQRVLVNLHDGRWYETALGGGQPKAIATPLPGIVDGVLGRDGQSIVFSLSTGGSIDDNDIWLYDLATERLRKLTQMPRLQHEPAWSADGRSVYFLSGDGGQAHDIWRVDVASGATEQLTVNDLYHFDLALRGDGAMLYSSNRTGDYEIWMQAPHGAPVQLTQAAGLDARPSWSPEGRQFVFESTREGEVAIYRGEVEGHAPVRISPMDRAARAPVWFVPQAVAP